MTRIILEPHSLLQLLHAVQHCDFIQRVRPGAAVALNQQALQEVGLDHGVQHCEVRPLMKDLYEPLALASCGCGSPHLTGAGWLQVHFHPKAPHGLCTAAGL